MGIFLHIMMHSVSKNLTVLATLLLIGAPSVTASGRRGGRKEGDTFRYHVDCQQCGKRWSDVTKAEGYRKASAHQQGKETVTATLACATCDGTGKVPGKMWGKNKCKACAGTGFAEREVPKYCSKHLGGTGIKSTFDEEGTRKARKALCKLLGGKQMMGMRRRLTTSHDQDMAALGLPANHHEERLVGKKCIVCKSYRQASLANSAPRQRVNEARLRAMGAKPVWGQNSWNVRRPRRLTAS